MTYFAQFGFDNRIHAEWGSDPGIGANVISSPTHFSSFPLSRFLSTAARLEQAVRA